MLDLSALILKLTDEERQQLYNLLLESDIARHIGKRTANQIFKAAREKAKGKLKKLCSAFAQSKNADLALDIFYGEMKDLGLWP